MRQTLVIYIAGTGAWSNLSKSTNPPRRRNPAMTITLHAKLVAKPEHMEDVKKREYFG
jgi:hypothetical protein